MFIDIGMGQTGTVSAALSGIMGPDRWVLIGPSYTITAAGPQGWIITADSETAPTRFTVTVPASANGLVTPGAHEIRWRGVVAGYGYQRYAGSFSVPA